MDTWTGILVDPTTLTITAIEIKADWRAIAPAIGASLFDVVRLDEGHIAYVDDEGLMKGPQAVATMLRGYPQPLMGKVLILRDADAGETASATWTVEDVRERVDFVTFGKAMDGVIVVIPINRHKAVRVVTP